MRTLNAIIPDQSALHTIRTAFVASILRPGFWNSRRKRRRLKLDPRLEVLQQDLIEKGELLLDALRLERHASQNDDFERWRSYRTMVNGIAQDYAAAVAAWRQAIEEDLLPARLRLSNVD
jgi:hypothetical protein